MSSGRDNFATYLFTQISGNGLQLAAIHGGLVLNQLQEISIGFDAPQVQEGGVQLVESFLESAQELSQGGRGRSSGGIANDAAGGSLKIYESLVVIKRRR